MGTASLLPYWAFSLSDVPSPATFTVFCFYIQLLCLPSIPDHCAFTLYLIMVTFSTPNHCAFILYPIAVSSHYIWCCTFSLNLIILPSVYTWPLHLPSIPDCNVYIWLLCHFHSMPGHYAFTLNLVILYVCVIFRYDLGAFTLYLITGPTPHLWRWAFSLPDHWTFTEDLTSRKWTKLSKIMCPPKKLIQTELEIRLN